MLEVPGEVNTKDFWWCEGPSWGRPSYVRVQLNENKIKLENPEMKEECI